MKKARRFFAEMNHYIAYYENQVGGGVDQVFVGSPYQRGNGIGSFLSGLFRKALPILSSGARTVGKEALRAGVGILSDLSQSMPFSESVRMRSRDVTNNLKRKADEKVDNFMTGAGYKRLRRSPASQILLKRRGKKSRFTRKKKKKNSAKPKTKRTVRKKRQQKTSNRRKKTTRKGSKKQKKSKVTDIFDIA